MVGHLLIEGFFFFEPCEVKLLLCFKLNKENVPCLSAMDLFFMFAFVLTTVENQ